MRLTADVRAPRQARAHVHEQLTASTLPVGLRDELLLITSELVTNAVQSGSSFVELAVDVAPDQVVLTVDDDGAGWPVLAAVSDMATGGRGLSIVDHLADEWDVHTRPSGKRVTVVRRVRPDDAG